MTGDAGQALMLKKLLLSFTDAFVTSSQSRTAGWLAYSSNKEALGIDSAIIHMGLGMMMDTIGELKGVSLCCQ